MENNKTIKFDLEKSYKFIHYLNKNKNIKIDFNHKKNIISHYNENYETLFEFKLPLIFPSISTDETVFSYEKKLKSSVDSYIILLIQAGSSSIGYFKDGNLIHHKVIKKYMVRKKQGKAQITYLKRKGKSRLGSRIRLANTIDFFEEINEKLNEWKPNSVNKILYSCPVRLWGLLFKSKVKTPFNKEDYRLIKIPLDVNIPNFDELIRVNRFAQIGFLKTKDDFIMDF
ncbi:MAG: hypothetical protein OEV44_01000 [Spirochaetota bacterium]|nr:hypothetical protein [Spirochaetota bacterium]